MNSTLTASEQVATYPVALTAGQFSELRRIVNDHQDMLFKSLHVAVEHKHDVRAAGLRDTLRYWDSIDRELARVSGVAFDAQHAAQADL